MFRTMGALMIASGLKASGNLAEWNPKRAGDSFSVSDPLPTLCKTKCIFPVSYSERCKRFLVNREALPSTSTNPVIQ